LSGHSRIGRGDPSYVDGIGFAAFAADRMRYSAVIREFEIIGEAVGKLADDTKTVYSDISWKGIKEFRNLLVHEYFGVDLEIVWNTILNDEVRYDRNLGRNSVSVRRPDQRVSIR
jgi:uncharacterized protein with HEPN domain